MTFHIYLQIMVNYIYKVKTVRFTIIVQTVRTPNLVQDITNHHKNSNSLSVHIFRCVSFIPFYSTLCMTLASCSPPPSSFTPSLNVGEHLFRRI